MIYLHLLLNTYYVQCSGGCKMVLNLDDVEKTEHFIFSRSLKKKTEVTGNP